MMELLLEGGGGGPLLWAALVSCRLGSVPCMDPVVEAAAEGTSLW